MGMEQMESFAQVIVCDHVNETQGKHFRNSGTVKSSVHGPVDPRGLLTEGTTECELMIQESGCSGRCQCPICCPQTPTSCHCHHPIVYANTAASTQQQTPTLFSLHTVDLKLLLYHQQ